LRATKSVSELTSTTIASRTPGVDADQAFGSGAASLLVGLGDALLAQPINGGIHVAIGLSQRGLAVHHAGAAQFAEFLHLCSRNAHLLPLCLKALSAPSKR
jgi:hypothetical protein